MIFPPFVQGEKTLQLKQYWYNALGTLLYENENRGTALPRSKKGEKGPTASSTKVVFLAGVGRTDWRLGDLSQGEPRPFPHHAKILDIRAVGENNVSGSKKHGTSSASDFEVSFDALLKMPRSHRSKQDSLLQSKSFLEPLWNKSAQKNKIKKAEDLQKEPHLIFL